MHSLKKRYFIKLTKSISDAIMNFALLFFVPRVLGPSDYGSFSFIRESFRNIISLADLNLSSAHVNHAARRDQSSLATSIYLYFTFVVGLLVFAFLSLGVVFDFNRYVFPGQNPSYLYAGATLAYLMYLYNAAMGLSDSKGATYHFELVSILVSVMLFVSLLLLYVLNFLTLTTFFFQRIFLYLVLLVFCTQIVFKKTGFTLAPVCPKRPDVRAIVREFASFSYPLVTLSVFGVLFGLFDRWFLQVIYGSISQGFFSLAFSISSAAALFLSPMTPLLMQSIARADEDRDINGISKAFDMVKVLFLLGAFVSFFSIFHSAEILRLIGDESYSPAKLTMMIMFLYPAHVVYGQFCGGVLIALKKTRLYRNISLVSAFLGVFITYLLLAPKTFLIPGFQLDSIGLALKLVIVQFVSVTLQLFFVCKMIGRKLNQYLISQLFVCIFLLATGGLEWFVARSLSLTASTAFGTVINLICSFCFWGLIIGLTVWFKPDIYGLSRASLLSASDQVASRPGKSGS